MRSGRGRTDAERRAIEEARRATEAAGEARLLRDALDVLPLGVVVADSAGRPLFRNRLAESLFASRRAEALAAVAVEEGLAAALDEGPQRRVVELHGPPPRTLVVSAQALPAGAAVAFVQDVTELQHLETVRRDFVANVSHELRTPIGALGVLAEAIAQEEDAAVILRLSARIAAEVERAGRIIEDLLDLSRIEVERAKQRSPLAVAEIVAAALERVRPVGERYRVTIRFIDGPARLRLLGDERQLVSAVVNLVDNAVKYSEPGSDVEVETRAAGEMAEVVVRDHGIGIPSRDLARVFERFYRVDQARSRQTGGTGLGLSIVRHVATSHGGDVLVESQEGEGSTFTLRIPREAP